MEVFVENFNEIMNCFEIAQVVIVHVHTNAEIEASIPSVYNLEVAELEIDKRCSDDDEVINKAKQLPLQNLCALHLEL